MKLLYGEPIVDRWYLVVSGVGVVSSGFSHDPVVIPEGEGLCWLLASDPAARADWTGIQQRYRAPKKLSKSDLT